METNEENKLSRRKFFMAGVGTASALVATKTFGQACFREPTADQPLGPFFPRQGTPVDPIRESEDEDLPIYLANDNNLTYVKGRRGRAKGQVVYIWGRVVDQDCQPVEDAHIVIWQAAHTGRYNHKGDSANKAFRHPKTKKVIHREHDPSFQYWGRATTNRRGVYIFKTIVPGFYPANLENGWYRPPHIHFLVSATGFPQLVTQSYFKGDKLKDNEFIQELNKKDYLLQSRDIPDEEREKLVVNFREYKKKRLFGRFDITLRT